VAHHCLLNPHQIGTLIDELLTLRHRELIRLVVRHQDSVDDDEHQAKPGRDGGGSTGHGRFFLMWPRGDAKRLLRRKAGRFML
jgi:hypothetical protein